MQRPAATSILLLSILTANTFPAWAQDPLDVTVGVIDDNEGADVLGAFTDSLKLLLIEHGTRIAFQEKTRGELRGNFWKDYARSVRMPGQWEDTDSWLVNYVGHPIHGAAAGYLWLDHEPGAPPDIRLSRKYWASRGRATAWAAGYSLQFEIGPLSEASIGNVGMRPETTGWVDHVVTPLGAFGRPLEAPASGDNVGGAMPAEMSRISVTAKLAAYYRQFSDIAFAKEVATRIGADEAFERILRDHGLKREELTFYAPMFEARYKSITELIRKSGASQVLELASGYSLRGLDLTRTSSIRYVEADLADVVATKLRLLDDIRREHGIASSSLHAVVVADALEFEQVRTAAAPFDRGQQLVVLCEGLIGYLTRDETERLAANIHRLLAEFAVGWWIVPDFSFKADVRDLPPARGRLREAVTGITQRQLDASAFDDADDLAAFLHRVGFDAQVRSQVDETPSFSSIPALGLSPALIERLRPVLRLWVMTPRPQA